MKYFVIVAYIFLSIIFTKSLHLKVQQIPLQVSTTKKTSVKSKHDLSYNKHLQQQVPQTTDSIQNTPHNKQLSTLEQIFSYLLHNLNLENFIKTNDSLLFQNISKPNEEFYKQLTINTCNDLQSSVINMTSFEEQKFISLTQKVNEASIKIWERQENGTEDQIKRSSLLGLQILKYLLNKNCSVDLTQYLKTSLKNNLNTTQKWVYGYKGKQKFYEQQAILMTKHKRLVRCPNSEPFIKDQKCISCNQHNITNIFDFSTMKCSSCLFSYKASNTTHKCEKLSTIYVTNPLAAKILAENYSEYLNNQSKILREYEGAQLCPILYPYASLSGCISCLDPSKQYFNATISQCFECRGAIVDNVCVPTQPTYSNPKAYARILKWMTFTAKPGQAYCQYQTPFYSSKDKKCLNCQGETPIYDAETEECTKCFFSEILDFDQNGVLKCLSSCPVGSQINLLTKKCQYFCPIGLKFNYTAMECQIDLNYTEQIMLPQIEKPTQNQSNKTDQNNNLTNMTDNQTSNNTSPFPPKQQLQNTTIPEQEIQNQDNQTSTNLTDNKTQDSGNKTENITDNITITDSQNSTDGLTKNPNTTTVENNTTEDNNTKNMTENKTEITNNTTEISPQNTTNNTLPQNNSTQVQQTQNKTQTTHPQNQTLPQQKTQKIYLDNLTNSNWISDLPYKTFIEYKNSINSTNYTLCPIQKPFVNKQNQCFTCNEANQQYFNTDTRQCMKCPLNTKYYLFYHKCMQQEPKYQTNVRQAGNLLTSQISQMQWEAIYDKNKENNVEDCLVNDLPYFDGNKCRKCPEQYPYFDLYKSDCMDCQDGTQYDQKQRQCLDESGTPLTPNLERLMANVFAHQKVGVQ